MSFSTTQSLTFRPFPVAHHPPNLVPVPLSLRATPPRTQKSAAGLIYFQLGRV
ncbi:hypothetical protein BDV10DRAFT_160569, partial [Aspergillus recurvatus]